MFQNNLKRILIDACFAIAIVFNIYYLATTHFSFMLSLFHYKMFNIPAISYTLMRFLYILLPVFLLVPEVSMEKVKRIKYSFYAMGLFYLLGNTWIIYFLIDNPASMLSDTEALHNYLQLAALNFDYLVWDSYDLYGILFSTIEAALFFVLGYYIDKRRRKSVQLYWLTLVCSVLLPVIYVFLLSDAGSFSSMWLQKNTVLFTSGIFLGAGLSIASTSHSLWGDVIWG